MTTKRTAVVTGATSGLGEAAALALAAQGYRVIVVGRDETRGADVIARVKAAGGEAEIVTGDLFTVAGTRRIAGDVRRLAPRIDVLINNAGGTFSRTERTADGFERTTALNVIAPFVLSEALLPQLAAARGRIVNVVTGVPKGAKTTLDQLTGARAEAGMGAYIRAKLALIALTAEQQRRHAAQGITAVSLHPGVIPDTRFGGEMPAFLRKMGPFVARVFGFASTFEQAAERYVRVATGEVEGGGFYHQGTLAPAPRMAAAPAFSGELWAHLQDRLTTSDMKVAA